MSIPADRMPVQTRPWYREPWPWFLMLGPLAAVIMGVVMVTLALRTDDGLVAEDYYKQGLAINETLDRQKQAKALGVQALVLFNPELTRVRLTLQAAEPDQVTLKLVHPTRGGLDQTVAMRRTGPGTYEGELAPVADGRWHLVLEDPRRTWRILGAWRPGEASSTLAAR